MGRKQKHRCQLLTHKVFLKNPGEPEQQKQSERPEIPNRPEGSTEPEGPVGGKRTKKINRKIPILIAVIVLLAAGGVGLVIGHSSGDSSGNEQNTEPTIGTQEIAFVPDYDYPDRQIRFEVPSNAAIEGPDLTNDIRFYSKDSGVYGIIDYFFGEKSAWIDTDEERIALWDYYSENFVEDETLINSGFVEIDERTCSWFETTESDGTYFYHLIMPYSADEQDACELDVSCDSYADLCEYIDQILSTITIISE